MPQENRYDALRDAFKAELKEYVSEGFRASDCFPFVFADVVEKSSIPAADRTELRRELSAWTAKMM